MIDRILPNWNGDQLKLYLESKGIEVVLTQTTSDATGLYSEVIQFAPAHEPVVDAWLAGYDAGWS